MLATQTANVASMRLAARLGFTEVERFHAWDADQWLGSLVVRPRPEDPVDGQIRRRERSSRGVDD